MKVLMIGQLPKEAGGTYTTGVCNVVYELSRCENSDVEMHVYATNMAADKENNVQGKAHYHGTRMRFFCVIWNIIKSLLSIIKEWRYYIMVTHLSPIRSEFYKDNIIRLIKETRPDIIHCMNILQMAPLYYANKKGIPTVLTLHGVFFDNDKNTEEMTRGNTLLADYVTGLTPETMKGIENLHFPIKKTFMVPNGTDTNKFYYDSTARDELRKKFDIQDNTLLMLTVASLQPRKGQLSFCNVLRNLPDTFNYKYLIIGQGVDGEKINKFIIDNNLQDRIQVIGYVSNIELYKYYSASDVYIHSSYEEGQALSEVEAYATGLRVALNKDIIGTVVTDTSNTDDYFIFDYDAFDSTSFVNWAKQRYDNRHSRTQYDWRAIFDRYIEVYNKVLDINHR